MKKFLNIAFAALFLVACNSAPSAYGSIAAQFECPRNLSEVGPGEYRSLGNYEIPDVSVKDPLNPQKMITGTAFLHHAASKYAMNFKAGRDFLDVLSEVYKSVKLKNISAVEKAALIGEFGVSLDPLFEALVDRVQVQGDRNAPHLAQWKVRYDAVEDVKRMKFTLAMAVADVENFSLEEYVEVSNENFFMTTPGTQEAQTHLPLDQYTQYVESYIASNMGLSPTMAKLYDDIPAKAPGGILSISDIRNVTSYNVWPMYLKFHDIKHIHYGLSHPLALGAMMRATRSKISLRYTMLGGLFEGIDRVQYFQETSINRFFAREVGNSTHFPHVSRNLDLEESMLMIGYLPETKLLELSKALPGGVSFTNFADELRDWKPKLITGTNLRGFALTAAGRQVRVPKLDLEEDVKDMVFRYQRMHLQSETLKEKIRRHPQTELSEDEKMLLWAMNFQMNPRSPEIVIPGLRFKNDGRAHYQYGDLGSPIGIGDQ